LSPVLYLIGVAAALRAPRLAQGVYVLVALLHGSANLETHADP
jgi:hypothetical protein